MTGFDRRPAVVSLLCFLSLAAFLAIPLVGEPSVGLAELLHPRSSEPASLIYWRIRLPRCAMAFLAGCGLSAAGMVFQALFQNPLASPFTLGVAGGASLGAALYVRLGLGFQLLGIAGISLAAFLGALLSMVLVYALSRRMESDGAAHVLLAGIAVHFSFSGAISLVQYLSDYAGSFRIIRWLMGGLEVAGFGSVFQLLPLVLLGILTVVYFTEELNLITTGEEMARSRGVAVGKVKLALFSITSLMVGGVVSFCGPIGFVGMMAPHMARRLVGPDHRHLTPAAILTGGLFLAVSDTVARQIIAPAELPVGVMTSLFGGPFFLWLLLRKKRLGRQETA